MTALDAGELFRRHAPFVAGFLVRLGISRAHLDDAVQDVFLVAHRRGGYAPGPARPTTWLAEIAIRIAQAHRRSRAERERPDPIAAELVDGAASPADTADRRQALARVQRALDTLDVDHRAVFVLFELEGEACDAIAAGLGIPTGTVYSRLHHARRRFRDAWDALAGEGA